MKTPRKKKDQAPANPKGANTEQSKDKQLPPPTGRTEGEPTPKSDRGCLDTDVVAWRKKNWPKAKFEEHYPESRLRAADLHEHI